MARHNEMTAARVPAGVVSLQAVLSARVEAQRIAREKLLTDRAAIQADIDTLLGRLMRLQRDFERCLTVGTPSARAMNKAG